MFSFCSDPDGPLLDISGGAGGASGSGGPSGPSMRGGRHDVTLVRRGLSSDGSAGQFRPSRAAAVEQWARQSSGSRTGQGGAQATAATAGGQLPRRGSDSSGIGVEAAKGELKLRAGIYCLWERAFEEVF